MFCGYETYDQYLLSSEWREKREKALEEQGRRCCICGATDNLHVHHLAYVEVDGRDMSPVRVLCQSCHKRVHASSDYITGKFGIIIEALFSAVIADTMAVLWKGNIPAGSTTRLKGILVDEFKRSQGLPATLAPAIYKANFFPNKPETQFDRFMNTATDVWNLNNGGSE